MTFVYVTVLGLYRSNNVSLTNQHTKKKTKFYTTHDDYIQNRME